MGGAGSCQGFDPCYVVRTMYKIKQAAMLAGVSVPVLRARGSAATGSWPRSGPQQDAAAPTQPSPGPRTMRRMVVEGCVPRRRPPRRYPCQRCRRRAVPDAVAGARPLDNAPVARGHPDDAIQAFSLSSRRVSTRPASRRRWTTCSPAAPSSRLPSDYILPAMVALGRAWAAGDVDVAAEHGASHGAAQAGRSLQRPVAGAGG